MLLDAGASLAARDRRNKGIMDYAGDDSPVRTLLEERHACCSSAQTAFGLSWILVTMNHVVSAFLCSQTCLERLPLFEATCAGPVTHLATVLCKCLVQDDRAGSGS